MTTSKRLIGLFLAIALLVTLVAGCSQSPTTASQASGSAATTAASAEKVKLKMALWDYDSSVYDKAMVEAFQASQSKITVDVVSSPNADYENKLAVMLAGGDEIDVFYAKSNTQYPTFVLKNYMYKLDDLIAKDKYDLTPYGTVLEQHYKINNAYYALPYRTNDWVIYYNKKVFDKAGVAYPTNNMTWEAYRELAKKVTSGAGADKIYGASYIPKTSFIVPTLVSKEKNFDILTSDFKSLSYPIQYVLDLQNTDKSYELYATSKSMSQDQTYFYKGKTAMLYNGSWFTQMLIKDAAKIDFEWGIVKSPYWNGTEQTGFATTTPVCISAKTKKVDAAWQLLKYLTGEQGAKIMAQNNMVPSYQSADVMNTYKTSTKLDANAMTAITGNKTYALGAPHALLGLVSNMINEEVELVITGNQTIDQAIAKMTTRRAEIIAQNK